MSRSAPRVHTEPVAIARLQHVAMQLPQDARVHVELEDGSRLRGMVSMTPAVQVFFDPDGREGHNGDIRDLWLDTIIDVEPLPNPTPPEASTRIPPDPNAPAT